MSTDPEAKLFYGYMQPESDREQRSELEEGEDTPWSATHTKHSSGCVGGMHGYDENLGFFLAVEESLHEADWDKIIPLTQKDLEIQPEWDGQLRLAAADFHLDLTGLKPSWYLVCLYF